VNNTTKSPSFDELVERYHQAWFRFHPEAAVEVGVPGYAHLLTPYSEEEKGALICLNDELRVSLEELGRTQLTPDQQIDYDILYGAALLENQRLLEIEPAAPDPSKLLPLNAIYQLTIRTIDDLPAALLARLAAIPAHLAGARDHLRPRATRIPALWLESAVMAARRGVDFMQDLPAHPKVAATLAGSTELQRSVAAASRSLSEYADFLERELAQDARGDFASGKSYFANLLHYRHFLDVDANHLQALGEQLFAQTERDLKDVCKELYGHDDFARASKIIQADHPAKEALLETYRVQMRSARDFVVAKDLVTLPTREHLDVVETPVFMRHQVPFAAYQDPAANDPEQHGYYYVTPPQDEKQLAEHNYAGLMHTCVHEAYPGHHLQFVTAHLNRQASTLPRLLHASSTLYEGWALYCEQLMHEQGFLNRPEQRFILLKDRLWRALRILIDVGIHTRGTRIEQAADRMVTHLGFPREQALADLKWYSRAPTVPMGYATGWALINALRDRLRAENASLSLREFHDRLLSAGSIGLPLVIRRVFGENMWQNIRGMVFGAPVP
jgi:uncharacterized protein (DUF885 family)